jgi:hypothetical protein
MLLSTEEVVVVVVAVEAWKLNWTDIVNCPPKVCEAALRNQVAATC